MAVHRIIVLLGIEVLLCWAMETEMPKFLQEPPKKLLFSNETGATVSCSVVGRPAPRVSWILVDGTQAATVPGIRQNMGNGTLFFPPFRGTEYRPEVHDAIYRCRAESSLGVVLSRNVHVRAVVRVEYKPHVPRAHVLAGNTGVLACTVPVTMRDHVMVTSWYVGDTVVLPDNKNNGERVVVVSKGRELHVRNARSEDSHTSFSCLTVDKLTGDRKRSDSSNLIVSEASGNVPPRLIQRPPAEIVAEKESDVELLCIAHGNPSPSVMWFKENNGRRDILERSGDRGRLIIRSVKTSDAGRWICKVHSTLGEQTTVTNIIVTSPLMVTLEPELLVINYGSRAILNCTVHGIFNAEIEWLRQGVTLTGMGADSGRTRRIPPSSLLISSMAREDAGIYQCIAKKGIDSAQAASRILLGDTAPELQYTFIEQALRPGSPVSLRCSATGTPAPRFSWYLDEQPLKELLPAHRYSFSQYVEHREEVASYLNISMARAEDGGLYSCKAENSVGSATHTARLNIYGQPYIRFISPLRAVAGNNVTIYCPYSGYPINGVLWERQGVILSNSLRHHTNAEGGLQISTVVSGDAGAYTCSVASPSGELARRDLQLIVLKPPQVAPFIFPTNVEEGSNIQATCSVMSGDRPIFFSWLKDNVPIPASLEVEQRSVEFFSLLIIKEVTSQHTGLYTCVASNSAAKANYSAELIVRVAPQWIFEPQDISTLIGTPLKIHCAAKGFPIPQITWMKGQGTYGQAGRNFQPLDIYDPRLLENGTLSIKSASSQDEGYYLCKATNDIGSGLSKTIYIGVNEPPRFELGSRNISTKREDSVTLLCEVFGDNPILIVWTHDMYKLDSNNYRLIISEAKTENGMRSQLYIRQTDRQDSGLYKCQAENAYGRSELVLYLAVQERPDSPVDLEVMEVNSRVVRLSWKRPFDGNSPVSNYLVQYRLLQSSNEWNSPSTTNVTIPARQLQDRGIDTSKTDREQAIISGLSPANSYIIRMLAINQIDSSSFSTSVIAKTLEEAPLEPPRNIQVQPSGPGELHVTWQAPPKDKWNGELLGYTILWQENSQITSIVNNTKSASVSGWTTSKFTITGLNKFTSYSINVKAFNSVSHGPPSPPVVVTTLEGVPEAPPEDVSCVTLSPQSIKISWRPPPPLYRGGVIQGYKIYYRPMNVPDNLEQWTGNEVKRTSGTETQLHALQPHTTYALQARAYTSAGDGIASRPIHCTTDEDVPGQPNGVKAISLSIDSVLVSWRPPIKPNGHIKHYTVYVREANRSSKHVTYTVPANQSSIQNPVITTGEITYLVKSLKEGHMYEFWVSATTGSGEGESTAITMQEPMAKSSAKIASFGGVISVGSGSALLLGCRTGGSPPPRTRWLRTDAPVTHHQSLSITHHGDLYIPKIDASLADNFTCVARNSGGEDTIVYQVRVLLPPSPPTIHVLLPQESHSLRLRLDSTQTSADTTPAHGYVLNFKREIDEWQSIDLSPDSNTFTIEDLKCGSVYHLYVVAHNKVGEGSPSSIVVASTKGGAPKVPPETDFILTNSSTIRMNMYTWEDLGCPIMQFVVEYKPFGTIHWIRVDNQFNSDTMYITDLMPATWYQLKVSAVNEAGTSVATFNFATTTLGGARIAAPSNYPDDETYSDDNLIDSIVLMILFVVIMITVVVMIFILLKRRRQEVRSVEKPEDDNCRNCQQVYSALPIKSNGKSIDESSELYEISPYATFSVGGVAPQPSRSVTAATLDYTLQFRTFGHTENEGLNPPPPPPCAGYPNRPARFRHKQRCYHSTEDEATTLSKAETVRLSRTAVNRRKTGGAASCPPDAVDSDSEDSAVDPRFAHRRPTRAIHHADTEM